MQATAIVCVDKVVKTSGLTDRVPWWSFTKTALAIAVLLLVEDGLLQLDEKLPDEAFNTRQLLRHEAGLPDYREKLDTIPTWPQEASLGRWIDP